MLLFFKCNFNSLFSLLQAKIMHSHSYHYSAPGGLQGVKLWLQCMYEGFPGRVCIAKTRKGRCYQTRSPLGSFTRSSLGFVSRLRKNISEESNEVIVHLIFCMMHKFYLLSLEGCTRNKQIEAENVLISKQYLNTRAGRQAGRLCAVPGWALQYQPWGRRRPC